MKSKIILSIIFSSLIACTFGQNAILELTFTGIDSAAYVQLDSIKVMNRTQGGDTVLHWPDTLLMLDSQVGIHEINNDIGTLQVFQNYPNPVHTQTTIPLYIPDKGQVCLMISDMLGREVISTERMLERGHHSFRFTPGSGSLFFCTARWRGNISTIKIINTGAVSSTIGSIEYSGSKHPQSQTKLLAAIHEFSFSLGDTLLYIGYRDTLQSGILDVPEISETNIFQFATNIPCPGTPTVEYEGQVYNTIQIFNQCWLKENLNVGTKIQGDQEMSDDGMIEKYCYFNLDPKCDEWGGLYQWDEMMQYSTSPGVQGICPPGWHIPTDEEIKVLEGAIDSRDDIGDAEWDGWDFRGYDIGYRLRSTTGWTSNGNGIDSHGFTLFPAGARFTDGSFIHSDNHAYNWSSNEDTGNYAWGRLIYTWNESCRSSYNRGYGFSVRCLQDY